MLSLDSMSFVPKPRLDPRCLQLPLCCCFQLVIECPGKSIAVLFQPFDFFPLAGNPHGRCFMCHERWQIIIGSWRQEPRQSGIGRPFSSVDYAQGWVFFLCLLPLLGFVQLFVLLFCLSKKVTKKDTGNRYTPRLPGQLCGT